MRRPPPLSELIHYPVTAGVCLLAIVASLCNFAGYNIEPIELNYLALHTEPWRLVTTAFPHVNVLHLLFNLYWTWAFGSVVETEFGSIWTAALMLMLAAGSSASEYALAGSGIGLSGVVYGLFGFLWVLGRFRRSPSDVVDSHTAWTFLVWFFLCIAATLSNYVPMANVAHGAGCVLGAIVGFAIAAPGRSRILARIGLGICLGCIGLLGTVGRRYVNFTMDGGEALAHMADVAFKTDDWGRAAKFLEQAVAYHRTNPREWFNLYVAYTRLGRHRDAIAALKHAPALDAASKELEGKDLSILGHEALADGQFRESLDLLHRAATAGQESESVWYEIGMAYTGLKDSDRAADAFRRADRLRRNAPADTQSSKL